MFADTDADSVFCFPVGRCCSAPTQLKELRAIAAVESIDHQQFLGLLKNMESSLIASVCPLSLSLSLSLVHFHLFPSLPPSLSPSPPSSPSLPPSLPPFLPPFSLPPFPPFPPSLPPSFPLPPAEGPAVAGGA